MKIKLERLFIVILMIFSATYVYFTRCMEATGLSENAIASPDLIVQGNLTIKEFKKIFEALSPQQVSDFINNCIKETSVNVLRGYPDNVASLKEVQRVALVKKLLKNKYAAQLVNLFALLSFVKNRVMAESERQEIRALLEQLMLALQSSLSLLKTKAQQPGSDRVIALEFFIEFISKLREYEIEIAPGVRDSYDSEVSLAKQRVLILKSRQVEKRALQILKRRRSSSQDIVDTIASIKPFINHRLEEWEWEINDKELNRLNNELQKRLDSIEPSIGMIQEVFESLRPTFKKGAGMAVAITASIVLYKYLVCDIEQKS